MVFFSALDQEFHVWDKGLIVQSIVQSMDPFLCQVSLANKKQPSCISRTSRKRGSCNFSEICGRVAFESMCKKKLPAWVGNFSWPKKNTLKERPGEGNFLVSFRKVPFDHVVFLFMLEGSYLMPPKKTPRNQNRLETCWSGLWKEIWNEG